MKDLPREFLDLMIVWPFIFAASSAACIWFRRRSRARLRRHLEGKLIASLSASMYLLYELVTERYLEHAVTMSVEQQHLDPLQAALTNPQRAPPIISYRVPHAVRI